MSPQLPAILSPPTSCIPALALTVSCRRSGCRSRLAPSRVGFRFWASPFPSRLANASGRIVFNMVLFMDWQFASGCSPPRLSTTQLPSTTDSQCSVRWGLSPHCWCALSGALGRFLRNRRGMPFAFATGLRFASIAHGSSTRAQSMPRRWKRWDCWGRRG